MQVFFPETICNVEVPVEEPASMLPVIIGAAGGAALLIVIGLILLCKFKQWCCFNRDSKVVDVQKKYQADRAERRKSENSREDMAL